MHESEAVLNAGDRVRLKSDPGRKGHVTGKIRQQAGITKQQIVFDDGITSYIPSYELETVEEDDLESLLEKGRFGRVRDLRRNLTYIHLSGRLANLVYSMDMTNTDFYAYQYKPVLSFLDSPSNGLLIADEVGLGKTIEAGLIWTEIRARFDARRLLVVCPAMLREKWCAELNDRFGVDARQMDAEELRQNLLKGKHETPEGQGIVCSIQGLRPPPRWDDEDISGKSGRAELARLLDVHAEEEPLIDLLIIDEAHYLRNPDSQSAKLGHLLRDVAEHIVLLSATPINLKDDDLYHLLNLVDPDSFAVKEVFPQVVDANEHLQKAREMVLDVRRTAEEIRTELQTAQQHPLLENSRQLADLISLGLTTDQLKEKAQRIHVANRIEKVNLLNHAYTRTRKAEVTEWRTVREPVVKYVALEEDGEELHFYQAVTNAIRSYALENEISDGFLLAGPQRQLSSCMYAAAKHWSDRATALAELEEQFYQDIGDMSEEDYDKIQVSGLFARLRERVVPNINLQELRANDSKYRLFKDTVLEYLHSNSEEKIIVFSFFRGTLAYLAERLSEDGVTSQVLVGGMAETKQDVIERFKKDKSLRVLLSSEVASEGVDLQFCHVLFNYDLPWNPMKVEQRIGRIDRIGQRSEKISIVNLLQEGTIDHKIHDRLYARLKIFERALGGMEAVLGEQITELTGELLRKPLTSQQEDERVQQTAMAIERIKRDQDELEEQASHLIAHGGYILEEVEAARQFKKRITEDDLVIYVRDYLERHWQGFAFRQIAPDRMDYEIRLPAQLAVELEAFIKQRLLYGQTRLATGEQIKCEFSNRVRERGATEKISQFHPLVRFISQDLLTRGQAFHPLVAMSVDAPTGFESGLYAFWIDRWEFSGIKVEEELPVRAMKIDSGLMLGSDDSWNLLNAARVNGKDFLEAADSLDIDILKTALDECAGALHNDFQLIKREKENENADRVTFQIESLERHRNRQLNSREETLAKHRDRGNTKMIAPTEGQIRKIKERFEFQKQKLLTKGELTAPPPNDVCCGVIKCTSSG